MQRTKAIALILVVLALSMVIGMKVAKTKSVATAPPTRTAATQAAAKPRLPRLVDLGSTTCIPCKKMAPILEQLKTELQGNVDVEFIDVVKNATAADQYKITVIPTQIFFDKDGKEVFRHEGFFPKPDILVQLQKMGVQTK